MIGNYRTGRRKQSVARLFMKKGPQWTILLFIARVKSLDALLFQLYKPAQNERCSGQHTLNLVDMIDDALDIFRLDVHPGACVNAAVMQELLRSCVSKLVVFSLSDSCM